MSEVVGEELAERKRELRNRIRVRIAGTSPAQRAAWDRRIASALLLTPLWRSARSVLLYCSLRDEVDTARLFTDAIARRKSIFLPVTDPTTWEIRFRLWLPGTPLVRRAGGVREPREVVGKPVFGLPAVVVVPGRAFDDTGRRLGRGRGSYDRTMAGLARFGTTIGLGYQIQLCDEVPHGRTDARVDRVLTEHGFVR